MALPQQIKSARMTNATVGSAIDDKVGELESALCDIFGFTVNTDITETPLSCDNSGRITKALLRLASAAPCGVRFRDTTNSKEFRIALSDTSITFDENTNTEGSPTWTNRLTLALGTGLPQLAAATDPTDAKDLTRKGYVDTLDGANVKKTTDQSIDGVKTFTSFPVGPSSAPTTDYQVANKKYVDDEITDNLVTGAPEYGNYLKYTLQKSNGTHGGGTTAWAWTLYPLSNEITDGPGIGSLSGGKVTLPAGTYYIQATAVFCFTNTAELALWNETDTAVLIPGLSVAGNYNTHSHLSGYFALASTKEIGLRYYVQEANAVAGLGYAFGSGTDEIYGVLEIWKVL